MRSPCCAVNTLPEHNIATTHCHPHTRIPLVTRQFHSCSLFLVESVFCHYNAKLTWIVEMNYMGNPSRLRSHPRSSQKEYFRRQRLVTPTPSERPRLGICQAFQSRLHSNFLQTGTESVVTNTNSTHGEDTFEVKRRRLLQQKDWLGLDVSAPIKVIYPKCS